ncbi:MAG: DUF202 domain-containing protein [Candidatus Aenigmatarchaeota archaeon]
MKRQSRMEMLSLEQTILSEERTLLSRERTILSFMQTALAFVGVDLVIVNIFESFNTQLVGWGLVTVGVVEIAESFRRIVRYRRAMAELRRRKEKLMKITGV